MSAAAVLPHRDALYNAAGTGLLQTETRMRWYEAEVPTTPPLDPDKRLHAYGVFWPSPGRPKVSGLCGQSNDLDWQFTVAIYAGDMERWLLARDWVCALLVDASPTVTGRSCGLIRMDYATAMPRRYDDPLPPRFGGPLLFTLLTVPA